MDRATPSYLKLTEKQLRERIDALEALASPCRLCPRECMARRRSGEEGYCRTGFAPVTSSAHPHFGEESPLVGAGGSGTLFFTNCNLRCCFCQNYDISQEGAGETVSTEELAELMVLLQEGGCVNINFVSPTHQIHAITAALPAAIRAGLKLPLVYNSGGYDSVSTVRLLDSVIDIYMPDLKFTDPAASESLADAPDYPEVAKNAIVEMHRQAGDLLESKNGTASRGLLVRHLVLPNGLAGSEEAFRFLAAEVSTNTYTNVMPQYRPCFNAVGLPEIGQALTEQEYKNALLAAQAAGLTRLDSRHRIRKKSRP